MTGTIRSVNVAVPQIVKHGNKEVATAIFKKAAKQPVRLTKLNFDGDAQGDPVNHGGPDKAVCVYPFEHYAYWQGVWGTAPEYGAFGENITLLGFPEDRVCIGDVFRLGTAAVQISQPRKPCFKLALKHGRPELPEAVATTGYTGYYFRVLEEGEVGPGDSAERLTRDPHGITVLQVHRARHGGPVDTPTLRTLAGLEPLTEELRLAFGRRLASLGEA